MHPEIYEAKDGMQEIVRKLIENPGVEVYFLTNIVAPLKGVVFEALAGLYPEINTDKVYCSCDHGASKKDPGGELYKKFQREVLNSPNPDSVLYIDDVPGYVDMARRSVGSRGFIFMDNLYTGRSAAQKLEHELELAGILES